MTSVRMTQTMNLLLLAPDIQENIHFLPQTTDGRDRAAERGLRAIIGGLTFVNQRHTRGEVRPRRRV